MAGYWTAGALIGGALLGSRSAKKSQAAIDRAAAEGAAATRASVEENKRQFDIGQTNLAPWLSAGKAALSEQEALMGLNGDSEGAMRTLQNSPGYSFRLNQGQRGLNAGLAARGGMGSGKSLVAGTNYNQDFASNEYGNRLNQLAGMSGTGQATANTSAGMGANYANTNSGLLAGNANSQGAAAIAGANLKQSSLNNLTRLGIQAYGMTRNGGGGQNTPYADSYRHEG